MGSRREFLKEVVVLSGLAGISRAVAEPLSQAATLAAATSSTPKVVVSPDGPIKTLNEARDAVRTQRRSGQTGPITITVRAGVYYLPETLVLGPEDSDTIWEAPHGEHPVISGGRVISSWTKAGPHAWTADSSAGYFTQSLWMDGVAPGREPPTMVSSGLMGRARRISPSRCNTAETISNRNGPIEMT
jgi:hypothetical protein